MNRKQMINNILIALEQLPLHQLKKVIKFTEILLNKTESEEINSEIQKLAGVGKAFQFLYEEEDIYTTNDLKEIYK